MNENHSAIIARVKTTPHPDPEVHSLAVGICCNETVIVSKSTPDNELGIYFGCELQIGQVFAEANDLIRRKDEVTGKPAGGMFDVNRRVRAQTFRGIKSEGFWAPLSYLEKCGVDISTLKEGQYIDKIGDIQIACKYETEAQKRAQSNGISKKRNKGFGAKLLSWFIRIPKKCKMVFPEHKDTSHFGKNLHKFNIGNNIVITEKTEGTSQRVAYNYEHKPLTFAQSLLSKFVTIDTRQMRRYNGTRRTVLSDNSSGGYFSETFRKQVADKVLPYLTPQMEVFFEVVGYEGSRTIAPKQDIKDKTLKAQYGDKMVYKYGCQEGQFDIHIYRIAHVLECGTEIDLPWNDVKQWCNAHKIKHVPELMSFKYDGDKDKLVSLVEYLSNGTSTIDNSHIREGICIRIDGSKWECFKNKSFDYKVLAGIAKDKSDFIDPEDLS
jgi:hypothetical protein